MNYNHPNVCTANKYTGQFIQRSMVVMMKLKESQRAAYVTVNRSYSKLVQVKVY